MEIIDYLRMARRRLWILLLVPLLALGAAVALVLSGPTRYSAEATVSASTLTGGAGSPYSGPQGVGQFAAAFTAAASSAAVRQRISEETDASASALDDNLTVRQSGSSDIMVVGFSSTSRDDVEPVLKATSRQVLSTLFAGRAAQAEAQRTEAQKSVQAANSKLAELGKANDMADPERAYTSQLSQVASLEQQQLGLRAEGNAAGADALNDPIKSARAKLATFGPILMSYNDLSAVQQAATADLTQAQAAYRNATGLASASAADGVTFIDATTEISTQSRLVKVALPVFAAGVFLAIVLVFLLEMLRSARTAVAADRAGGGRSRRGGRRSSGPVAGHDDARESAGREQSVGPQQSAGPERSAVTDDDQDGVGTRSRLFGDDSANVRR